MSREYPDWISPERAAEGKREFGGTIPLAGLKRLAGLLADVRGEASFVAEFKQDPDQRVVIRLKVQAALPLICQASLEPFDQQVKRSSELAVITENSNLEELPDHYDAVRTENGRLAIARLVEDELLLGLSSYPRKPGVKKIEYSTGGQKTVVDGPGESNPGAGKKNPFAALGEMLQQKKQN